ncbi:hypothetical protein ZWY2020_015848 [Hordeum vulgare]|nr:hypothetical protein ZWY2020_015848 [Hordeum vulgare]
MLEDEDVDYLVWDPVTGDRHAVPAPDIEWLIESAAVLCAADGCDHLDCHGGPFRVAFAATRDFEDTICASVYSSKTGTWSEPNSLSMIDPPPHTIYYIALIAMEENNSLGFAYIEDSSLCMWSRKVDTEGPAEWVQFMVIQLEKTIPVAKPDDRLIVVGSAEGVGVIFVSTGAGLFMIKLSSGQLKKVDGPGVYFSVLPYMSFYTSDRGKMLSIAGED